MTRFPCEPPVARFLRAPLTALLVAAAPLTAHGQSHEHRSPGETLGAVHFQTSCAPAVAAPFDRAVALLHSFEFGASIEAFTGVLASDSTCAMAHWGLALSRWGNPMAPALRSPTLLAAGRRAADEARRLATRATPREGSYARAVAELYADFERVAQDVRIAAYERAMHEVATRHPGDTEAQIFYAVALVGNAPPTDKSYAKQLQATAILEPLWAKQPDHPGLAHYIIHAYDVPALAPRALTAAHRYARIAPSASHALHMPSHTFTRVGAWRESVETNRRSAQEALRSGAIAEALHAVDYQVYAYLQLADTIAVKRLLDTLPAIAARFDPEKVTGAAPGSAGVFALAAIPARYALERDDWVGAATLVPRESRYPWTEAMTHFARALGGARTGRLGTARASADTLVAIAARLRASGESYWTEQVAIQSLGARAWIALAEGAPDSALSLMREAAAREDATEKAVVTPGPLAPARELLGDLLLHLGRRVEAREAYRATLQHEPHRRRATLGLERTQR